MKQLRDQAQEQHLRRRRGLRQLSPEPESRLWYYLRNRRLHGYKFRRQQNISRYVVDFYCAEAQLAIEVDGDSHYTEQAIVYDAKREQFLASKDIKTIRFTNHEVMSNIEGVLERITDEISKPLIQSSDIPLSSMRRGVRGEELINPSPIPSPQKGEGS